MLSESYDDIPDSLRELYRRAGPVIRFRIRRDLLNEDQNGGAASQLKQEILQLPEVVNLLATQDRHGTWDSPWETALNTLRLCELGLEDSPAVERCYNSYLAYNLLGERTVFQFLDAAPDGMSPLEWALGLQISRDLNILAASASTGPDPIVRNMLESVLIEWEELVAAGGPSNPPKAPLPSMWALEALMLYPWDEADLPRVRDVIRRMDQLVESLPNGLRIPDGDLKDLFLRHRSREELLSIPYAIVYGLTCVAKIGLVQELEETQSLLDHIESQKGTDGFYHLPLPPADETIYYFPLELSNPVKGEVEFTFRMAQLHKYLERAQVPVLA